jgi:putative hydrolase of the HAD superfamily
MTPEGIRAFIFDLGKVVFDYSFDETLSAWAAEANLTVGELTSRFKWDGTYERYERGELALEHFHRRVSEQIGFEIPFDRFEGAWTRLFRAEIPGIRDLLGRLREQYRLVALSNTNYDHARVWRRLFPEVLIHFESIFASHEIGARKPDPRAFQIVLDHLGMKSGEVVFIDDYADNVAAARQMGLKAFLFENTARLEEMLLQTGLLAPSRVSGPLSVQIVNNLQGEK